VRGRARRRHRPGCLGADGGLPTEPVARRRAVQDQRRVVPQALAHRPRARADGACAAVSRLRADQSAVVDFWQESPNGAYDRRGQASVVTGKTGTFRFEGPRPPAEGGRLSHIHVRVTAGGYVDFVTTYFLRSGEKTGRITIVLVSGL
jgi:hypothetical protein